MGCLWGDPQHPGSPLKSQPGRPGTPASLAPGLARPHSLTRFRRRPRCSWRPVPARCAPLLRKVTPLVPPRSRGPDLRNGGGAEPPPSAPTVAARPRASAPPPCARPGALPHGASGGGARGAPRVRARLREGRGALRRRSKNNRDVRFRPVESKPSGKRSPLHYLAFRRRAEGRQPRACVRMHAVPGIHGARRRRRGLPFLHSRILVLRGGLRGGEKVQDAPQRPVHKVGCTLML